MLLGDLFAVVVVEIGAFLPDRASCDRGWSQYLEFVDVCWETVR